MTGPRIWAMKMKFKANNDSSATGKMKSIANIVKPNDIVLMSTSLDPMGSPRRFLLKSINKKKCALEVIPLEALFRSNCFIEEPILLYPINMVSEIEALPKEDLLFLISQIENPHIYKAIKEIM